MPEQNSTQTPLSSETTQFKRNISFKVRIGDVLLGKPIVNGEKFSFLELGNKKIIRTNIIGNIIEKFESNSASGRTYIFLTLDDGSGQIKIKSFGDDVQRLNLGSFTQGQTILCIGSLRFFNNEIYVSPEIFKEMPAEYLLIRKLEIEKERNSKPTSYNGNSSYYNQNQQVAVKDKILELIKEAESKKDAGIEVDEIIIKVHEASPDLINQEIRKMLEEGIIFEPRPGKLRWLG